MTTIGRDSWLLRVCPDAQSFLAWLEDPAEHVDELAAFVTPEAREAWGDFTVPARVLEDLAPWGLGSQPKELPGLPDVRYAYVIPEVAQDMRSTAEQGTVAVILTLVWRAEHDRWMVASFGAPVPPEGLPRSSPGVGPGDGQSFPRRPGNRLGRVAHEGPRRPHHLQRP